MRWDRTLTAAACIPYLTGRLLRPSFLVTSIENMVSAISVCVARLVDRLFLLLIANNPWATPKCKPWLVAVSPRHRHGSLNPRLGVCGLENGSGRAVMGKTLYCLAMQVILTNMCERTLGTLFPAWWCGSLHSIASYYSIILDIIMAFRDNQWQNMWSQQWNQTTPKWQATTLLFVLNINF